ncbi:SAP domain-containing ribonucleoprotein-like [Silurus meridionalis]|uniref:SAP domain-containing ribonucleoprotein-like n=1 Tax=Silurus meridionalis TaxID=175797 RepID=UPI001EEB2254|nr:SAP domain-containing ribonucleoprotein-like [Silurus meridionalis]
MAELVKLKVYIEKMRKRAERFGMIISPVYKKVYIEKMRKRAERFGMIISPMYKKFLEEEKLKKRFGTVTSAASVGADDLEAKKLKRAERFGNV